MLIAAGGCGLDRHRRTRLGRHRWVIERSPAWLTGYRRLTQGPERRAGIHLGLLHLACVRIWYQLLAVVLT